jgi:hypothetical protein
MESHSNILVQAVATILRPIVRILLRHGVSAGAMNEIVNRVYVEVAEEKEFSVAGRKQSDSRISVLTGLHRKHVARIKDLPAIENVELEERHNRAVRVLSGWTRDRRFKTKSGRPAVLAFEGKKSFSELVDKYSGGVPTRAMLDELVRVGVIEVTSQNNIKLKTKAYVPGSSDVEKMRILGMDAADLISTIDHNMTHEHPDLRFQRTVVYDNISEEHVDEFRKLSAKYGQELLEKLDSWLAKHEDTSKRRQAKTVRLGTSVFQFEDKAETSKSNSIVTSKKKSS